MLNFLSRLFPGVALRYEVKRQQLASVKRLYEGASSSNYHKSKGSSRSGNGSMDHARGTLRDYARDLDENHDLAIGILDVLVNNIVGAGIPIEPMLKTRGGKLNVKANKQIRKLWDKWSRSPDVTGQYALDELERLVCRSWLRDGEILIQKVAGTNRNIKHAGPIPYSLELIESDFLPFDYSQKGETKIVHGVELDTWNRPIAYHLFKDHPGDVFYPFLQYKTDTKRVNADQLIHLKFSRRINQVRGVTLFHGVLRRLDDIKDYEESERIAARVAAAFTGYIKKSADSAVATNTETGARDFEMNPGMVFDNLLPGEEVGTIDSNRPNTGLNEFRNSQLRAIASGVGASYSSISKDYNGTYSAQRQEMVESAPAYTRLRSYFINQFIRPIYEDFITYALASGSLALPKNVDPESHFDCDIRGVGMPWIDPKKEVEADAAAVQNRFKSRAQVIRERGGDPAKVSEQIELELEADKKLEPIEPKPVAENKDDKELNKDDEKDDDKEVAA